MYSLYINELPRWYNGEKNICLLMQETQETGVGEENSLFNKYNTWPVLLLTQTMWFFFFKLCQRGSKIELCPFFFARVLTHIQIWIPYAIHVITLWKLIYSFIPHFSIMPPGKMLLDEKLSWITFFLQSTEMRVTNPLYISGLHKLLLNCHFNYSWTASLPPGKFHRDFK